MTEENNLLLLSEIRKLKHQSWLKSKGGAIETSKESDVENRYHDEPASVSNSSQTTSQTASGEERRSKRKRKMSSISSPERIKTTDRKANRTSDDRKSRSVEEDGGDVTLDEFREVSERG